MASCQSKVPGVRYCDESWWQDFFTKDLAEFYASLNGLLNARKALLDKLSGDLAQVLADPQRRDLALRVLFGGLDESCLEKIRRGYDDCITHDKAAHLYKYVLGIGLGDWGHTVLGDYYDKDLEGRAGLLNLLKFMSFEEIGKEKLKLGISINGYNTSIMNYLFEIKEIVDEIYSKIKQAVQVQQVQADYGLDLVKAFEDFLNKSIKLLPLYNPFTFFIQSLRSTPRPYLNIMYGEDLFSDPVRNLMSKYGVELTKILDPGLIVQSKNDELAVIGHKDGSVGELIVKLVWEIYDITSELNHYGYPVSDELKKYVEAKYNNMIKADDSGLNCCYSGRIEVRKGFCMAYGSKYAKYPDCEVSYEKFLELFSPSSFLGIAWVKGDHLYRVPIGD